jgi:hypothetical protein
MSPGKDVRISGAIDSPSFVRDYVCSIARPIIGIRPVDIQAMRLAINDPSIHPEVITVTRGRRIQIDPVASEAVDNARFAYKQTVSLTDDPVIRSENGRSAFKVDGIYRRKRSGRGYRKAGDCRSKCDFDGIGESDSS